MKTKPILIVKTPMTELEFPEQWLMKHKITSAYKKATNNQYHIIWIQSDDVSSTQFEVLK